MNLRNARVFVASSFLRRGEIREIHEKLKDLGLEPTSSWADTPGEGPEYIHELSEQERKDIVKQNDADLARSDIVLMIADPQGAESYAEVARALLDGRPVVWTGKKTCSTYRPGVVYRDTVEGAIEVVKELAMVIRVATVAGENVPRDLAYEYVVSGAVQSCPAK